MAKNARIGKRALAIGALIATSLGIGSMTAPAALAEVVVGEDKTNGVGSVNINPVSITPNVPSDGSDPTTAHAVFDVIYTGMQTDIGLSVRGVHVAVPKLATNVTYTLTGTVEKRGEIDSEPDILFDPTYVEVSLPLTPFIAESASDWQSMPSEAEIDEQRLTSAAVLYPTNMDATRTDLGLDERPDGYSFVDIPTLDRHWAPVRVRVEYDIPMEDAVRATAIHARWAWNCPQQSGSPGSWEENCQSLYDYNFRQIPTSSEIGAAVDAVIADGGTQSEVFDRHGLYLNENGSCAVTSYTANWWEFGDDRNTGEHTFNYVTDIVNRGGPADMYLGLSITEDTCDQAALRLPPAPEPTPTVTATATVTSPPVTETVTSPPVTETVTSPPVTETVIATETVTSPPVTQTVTAPPATESATPTETVVPTPTETATPDDTVTPTATSTPAPTETEAPTPSAPATDEPTASSPSDNATTAPSQPVKGTQPAVAPQNGGKGDSQHLATTGGELPPYLAPFALVILAAGSLLVATRRRNAS